MFNRIHKMLLVEAAVVKIKAANNLRSDAPVQSKLFLLPDHWRRFEKKEEIFASFSMSFTQSQCGKHLPKIFYNVKVVLDSFRLIKH